MTARKRPLAGRVVLVVGAGDPVARAISLHLAALGASVILAAPRPEDSVETAGFVAAQGGIARVVESPSPPLLGADLLRAASDALAPPTDAAFASSAFASRDAASAALAALAALLPSGAVAVLADDHPAPSARAAAERMAPLFLAGA